MSDPLKDFFISIGFEVDEASRKQTLDAVKSNEREITSAHDKAGQERLDRERFRQALRASGNDLTKVRMVDAEKETSTGIAKAHKEGVDRLTKIDVEAQKKAGERRNTAFKDLSKGALATEAVLTKVAGLAGIVGTALTGSSFFQGIIGAAGAYANAAQQSQRTGASVKGIQALLYGFSQVGLSREEANSSFEGFRSSLATNPGLKFLLKGAGIDTEQTPDKVFSQLGKYFNSMPKNVALARAGQLGISENTMLALENPALAGKISEGEAKPDQFGLDPDKAAKDGRETTAAYERLATDLAVVKDKIEAQFFKPMAGGFNQISDWLESHPDAANKFAEGMVGFATLMSVAVIPKFVLLAARITGITTALTSLPAWFLALAGANAAMAQPYLDKHGIESFDPATGQPYDSNGSNPMANLGPAPDPNRKGWFADAWNWTKGKLGLGGSDSTHVSPSGPHSRYGGSNFNKKNANSIVSAAKELGTTPEDLATVIGYESGFDPSKWGGANGKYMGLIQMGGPERAQFGANDKQSFPEQMGAVVRYLKGRGFKPGMGLMDLYSTINAGSPGHYGWSDGHGTVASHVANMQGATAAQARAMLALADAENSAPDTTADRRGQTSSLPPNGIYWGSDSKGHSVAVDAQGRAIGADGKPTTAQMPTGGVPSSYEEVAAYASNLMKQYRKGPEAAPNPFGTLDPNAFKTAPLATASPSSLYQSYDQSRGDNTFNQTVNVNGLQKPEEVASHIKLSARRGGQDYIRMMQGATQ